MANDKNANKATNKQNQADQSLLDILLGKGAVELRLERTMYAAEACGQVPVVGFLVDLIDMPPIDMGKDGMRDWKAFVIKLTHQTKGKDREDNIVDVEPGEEIVMPATYQIAAALARFARDPEVMHEVGIEPKTKLDIGGGKNFWTYRVIATNKTEPRGSAYALSDGKPKPAAQLPSADGSHTVDQKTGEAVPVQARA